MSLLPLPNPALTLATINIERSKHLSRVLPFLAGLAPDVICLQELIADDVPLFRERLGYPHHVHAPICRYPAEGLVRSYGVGIYSRHPFAHIEVIPYAGGGSGSDVLDLTSMRTEFQTSRYILVIATIAVGGRSFCIATTHFPWTPDGTASDDQHRACDRLLDIVRGRELVLCGDFNAPRGGAIFSRFASAFKDNIPATYTGSLDPKLHPAGHLELMVDGVFSTPSYHVGNVVLRQGISDHCAVSAEVRTANLQCEMTAASPATAPA